MRVTALAVPPVGFAVWPIDLIVQVRFDESYEAPHVAVSPPWYVVTIAPPLVSPADWGGWPMPAVSVPVFVRTERALLRPASATA